MSKKSQASKDKYVRLEREVVKEISSFLFAVGNQFVNVKNSSAAFDCFKYALDLNDKNVAAVYNLGCLYLAAGDFEGAGRMFRESLRMDSTNLMARLSYVEVLRKTGRVDEAAAMVEEAMKTADRDNPMVKSINAIVMYDQGRLAEALAANEDLLKSRPGDLHTILNSCLIQMTYGHWEENWSKYEFVLSYQKNERMRQLKMSQAWNGDQHRGKTLLVISDQGSGDAIQFSRYLNDAKKLGQFGKIVYLVQPDLKTLLSRVEGVDDAIAFGENLQYDYDQFSSLLGVMRVLKVTPENCYRDPHIVVDDSMLPMWEHIIKSVDSNPRAFRVGLVWAGDPKHGNDHARSLKFSRMLDLISKVNSMLPDPALVKFYSLQVGHGLTEWREDFTDVDHVVDLGVDFRSFEDTAAALKCIDLLVTCDTSVAHLGGCMGVETWVMVPNPPEWRWGLSGDQAWYKSVKLYRQSRPRDWSSVIHQVAVDIAERIANA